ncbi:hypothetical protein HDK64DRAFT_109004 [Phyllosticta capitalensis]
MNRLRLITVKGWVEGFSFRTHTSHVVLSPPCVFFHTVQESCFSFLFSHSPFALLPLFPLLLPGHSSKRSSVSSPFPFTFVVVVVVLLLLLLLLLLFLHHHNPILSSSSTP